MHYKYVTILNVRLSKYDFRVFVTLSVCDACGYWNNAIVYSRYYTMKLSRKIMFSTIPSTVYGIWHTWKKNYALHIYTILYWKNNDFREISSYANFTVICIIINSSNVITLLLLSCTENAVDIIYRISKNVTSHL